MARLTRALPGRRRRGPAAEHTDGPHGGGVGVGPAGVEVGPRWLRLGEGYATSFAVVGYPAQVAAGWLEPLACYPGRLDVALHIDPVPPAAAADRLRRQLGRLESTRRARAEGGRLEAPEVDAAAADARD